MREHERESARDDAFEALDVYKRQISMSASERAMSPPAL